MENLDTRSYEVGSVNGLPQFLGVNPEPTWTETPPSDTRVCLQQIDLNAPAIPVNPMQAMHEANRTLMPHGLFDFTYQSEVPHYPWLESFNLDGQEFREFIESETATIKKGSSDVAMEQNKTKQCDDKLQPDDDSGYHGSVSPAASSFVDVDPQVVSQEAVLGVMSMDSCRKIPTKSTQDIGIDDFYKVLEQTEMSQLIDPQLHEPQSLHQGQLNSSQQYATPQQPYVLQDYMIGADMDHCLGTPSPNMTSLTAVQLGGTSGPRLPQSELGQGSSHRDPNIISCYGPHLGNTRQEQLWRSQPQGPYYRGTKIPKKVVRNCFLNEWLSKHHPSFPLPNSSGQGFMEQNRVFGNLSRQDQLAVNAYVVGKVEEEQAEKRRLGLAKYRDIDVKTGKGRGGGAPKDTPGRPVQNSTNGTLLGRVIAPAPARYPQQGGAPNGAFSHQSNNLSTGSFQVRRLQFQAGMQELPYDHQHAYEGVTRNQYVGPIASQTLSTSFIQGNQGLIFVKPAVTQNPHGCQYTQQGNSMAIMQGGVSPMVGYLASLPGHQLDYSRSTYAIQDASRPQSNNPSCPYADPANGLPLIMTPNFGMQSPLDSSSGSSINGTRSPMTSKSSFNNGDPVYGGVHDTGETNDEDEHEESGQSSRCQVTKRARRA